jgi:hypothetical protein
LLSVVLGTNDYGLNRFQARFFHQCAYPVATHPTALVLHFPGRSARTTTPFVQFENTPHLFNPGFFR